MSHGAVSRPTFKHGKRNHIMLFVGIDIGKTSHAASLLSSVLLAKHHRYEACPTFKFENTRADFAKLLAVLCTHAPLSECRVIVERTGHYGRALEQYLREHSIEVFQVHVLERPKGSKSDIRDARRLAVLLYNQLERGVLATDKSEIAHHLSPPSESAQLLRGLVQHRTELVRERTGRKLKLIAINDELFPELKNIYADPISPSALALREKYPLPSDIADASVEDLLATRKRRLPTQARMEELQKLAQATIGTKDTSRLIALALEQEQLIKELTMLTEHIEEIDARITKDVAESREGKILMSIPMIGPMQAATLIAGIGSIANFESAAKLRAYAGWAPRQDQTGTSYDSMVLSKDGNRLLKHTLYLIALNSVKLDTPWKILYDRLVPLKCTWDERTQRWRGKMKVIGRIIGQMITVIYTLLRRDCELIATTPEGKEPTAPELYDVNKHRVKRK